jgi:PAS domain S-box-containing protein
MDPALEGPLIVLDTVPEAYVRLDNDFRFTFVNRAALSLLGNMPAELLGKKLWDVCPSSTGTPLDLGCRRAMAERIVVTTQHCFASEAWHSVVVMPDSRGGICLKFSDVSDHKLMEASLQKSEEEFHKVFRYSPYPLCVVDMGTHRLLDVNEAALRQSGYRRDEVVGRNTDELWLDMNAAPDILEEAWRRIREEGSYRNLEGRVRRKSGEAATILFSAERIMFKGKPCAMTGFVDITDRRQAEEALQESQELYRTLFEVEPEAVALVDRESGQILAANAAVSTLYGYTHEELLSMKAFDISAEPDKTAQALARPAFVPLRWHKKKDGTIFRVEGTICHFELKGRPVYLCIITPLDRQHQMAHSIAERKARNATGFRDELSDVLDSFGEGFQAFDREFRLTYMNRAAERILDRDAAELTGKPVWGEFPATVSVEVERQLRHVMRRRKPESSENFDVQRCRWFLINMYPFRDGVSVLFRDISKKKQWELQREQVIKELRHALGQVRTLHGLIPICAWCKKIRNDEGYWQQLEAYISEHTEADFSHGMCPDCSKAQLH